MSFIAMDGMHYKNTYCITTREHAHAMYYAKLCTPEIKCLNTSFGFSLDL